MEQPSNNITHPIPNKYWIAQNIVLNAGNLQDVQHSLK